MNNLSLELDIVDETEEISKEQLEQITNLLNYAAEKELIEPGTELAIIFVTNDRIKEINAIYRNKDTTTDVISFAMEETVEGEIEISGLEMPRMLGDIIISVPKAREQAEEYNHSFMRELGFLAIHGFLHLLGYDHETEADEKVMFNKQKELLNGYGLER